MRRSLLILAALVAPFVTWPSAVAAPGQTTVVTLPSVAGFTFDYEGRTYRTGSDGSVVVPVLVQGSRATVRTREVTLGTRGRARFDRWYVRSGGGSRRVIAAMSTYQKVGLRFVNLEGVEVPRSALDEVTLKSSTGFRVDVPSQESTILLQATRVVSESGGPAVKDLYFTVADVQVEGNSIVNRSQTKFFPRLAERVEVPLLFFDASIRARDAFFGFPVRGKLVLEYPNGHRVSHTISGNGRVALPGLPRGQYHISVEGPGLKLVQPVTMSRAQDVDLKVFTYVDIATVLGLGLAVAVGLLVAGQRVHRRRLAVATVPVERAPQPARPAPKRVVLTLVPVHVNGTLTPSSVPLPRRQPAAVPVPEDAPDLSARGGYGADRGGAWPC